jgi:hypothetical protein
MPNFQDLDPTTNGALITIERDTSTSLPPVLRLANDVLQEIYRLTHLSDYPLHNGVVSPDNKARYMTTAAHMDEILSKLSDLVEAYELIHEEFELRSRSTTLFVQEKGRPWVARLAEVNEDEWSDVENVIELCREGSEANLREAEDEIEQLLLTFGVDVEMCEFLFFLKNLNLWLTML